MPPNTGKIYKRVFTRKYGAYLGLKIDKTLFESLSEEPTDNVLDNLNKEKPAPPIIKDNFKRSLLSFVAVFALVFTLFVIGYAGHRFIRLIRGFSRPSSDVTIVTETEKTSAKAPLFPIPTNEALRLKVETTDAAWLRVKSDGKVIFERTLPKDSAKEWTADNELEIWAGRAEALDLALNGRQLGSPGRGRVRKIIIDHEGMRVEKR